MWYRVALDALPPFPSDVKLKWTAFSDRGVLLILIWSNNWLLLREVVSGRTVYRLDGSQIYDQTVVPSPRLGVVVVRTPYVNIAGIYALM